MSYCCFSEEKLLDLKMKIMKKRKNKSFLKNKKRMKK
jgi:hypothetical protein